MLSRACAAQDIALGGMRWLNMRFADFLPPAAGRWRDRDRHGVALAECAIAGLLAARLGGAQVRGEGAALLRRIGNEGSAALLARWRASPSTWARPLLVVCGALHLGGLPAPDARAAVRQSYLHGELQPASLRFDHLQEMQFWLHACGLLPPVVSLDTHDWQREGLLPHAAGLLVSNGRVADADAYILTHGMFYLARFGLPGYRRPGFAPLVTEACARCFAQACAEGNADLAGELAFAAWSAGSGGMEEVGERFIGCVGGAVRADGAVRPAGCGERPLSTEDVYHGTIASVLGAIAVGAALSAG